MGILTKLERLDFTIPDFLRTVWVSEQAREYWEPKIRSISASWHGIERLTLLEGMRPGVLQSITPEELPTIQNWALASNIPMAVAGLDGASESYGNASIAYDPGKKFTFRIYFGMEPERFLDAWKAQDNLEIGRMLGFPVCCSKAFQKHWQEEGWRDLTIHSFGERDQRNLMYNNVLLRHIGIRGVFHLPCNVNCNESVKIGAQILGIMMHTEGLMLPADWLQQLLVMPMEWTSLHGVAMVVTPILKTIYASDAIPVKATLRLDSEIYPLYGASGNRFPFQNVVTSRLHLNGFNSQARMSAAHSFIVSVLADQKVHGKILDLGCGDGSLLKRIQAAHPNTKLLGVDFDESVITTVVPGVIPYRSDIFEFRDWESVDLVLLSSQRLIEVPAHKASALMEVIANFTKRLLLYNYGEWQDVDRFIDPYFTVVSSVKNKDYRALLMESKHAF